MKVLVSLGDNSPLRWSPALAVAIRPVLGALIVANRLYLRTHHVPLLYKSGVRYKEEPLGTIEEFAAIPVCIERGWGDCDDLAPWRVAELREAGEKNASIRLTWRFVARDPDERLCPRGGLHDFRDGVCTLCQALGQKLFHVVVRRANGDTEDPSKILGMNS